jgi:hypothetical protein
MTYFEQLNEMKENFKIEMTTAKKDYLKAESKIIEALGNFVKDAEVDSIAFGPGKVTEAGGVTLDDMSVSICFAEDLVKRFSLKHILNHRIIKFSIDRRAEIKDAWDETMLVHIDLTTTYNKAVAENRRVLIENAKKAEADKKAEEKYQHLKAKALNDFEELSNKAKSHIEEEDFYYALGWLATHVGSVSAALPDYLEPAFTKHFGSTESTRIVDSKKRTCNGNSMQWTFGFKASLRKAEDIPTYLTQYLNTTGKMIANTSFIWDLIDDYGFQFGKKQNVEQIAQAVPAKYIDIFNEGLTA